MVSAEMQRSLKRKLVLVVAAMAAVAFAGGAYAATQSWTPNVRQAFLNDVAHRLNVTPAQLRAAVKGAYLDQLDTAVASGRSRPAPARSAPQVGESAGVVPFGGAAWTARRQVRATGGPGAAFKRRGPRRWTPAEILRSRGRAWGGAAQAPARGRAIQTGDPVRRAALQRALPRDHPDAAAQAASPPDVARADRHRRGEIGRRSEGRARLPRTGRSSAGSSQRR